jgi:type IV secretory pathway VirB4 component
MNKNNVQKNNSSTQNLMPINEIRNNTIILKNGSLRSIIEVDGINIDLMANEDQENVLRT